MPRTASHIMQSEPVAVGGGVLALLNLAAAFGLDLTAEQVAALNVVATSIVVPLVRRYVSPVKG